MLTQTLRVAMFNVSMSEPVSGQILKQTANAENKRFSKLAAIIQFVRSDVLLLCEFDHPGDGGDDGALANFCHHYLAVPQHGQDEIEYPYQYCPPSNTGLLSPFDLNGDGVISLPEDGLGFGEHHGHFSFVILSRYPIQLDQIRSWQHLLWRDMPEHCMPDGFYSEQAQSVLRLSSKNHVVVPVEVNNQVIHLLCCHPTPPVFDGEEKRNARRNHDELRLVTDIINNADYLVDDKGKKGGLSKADSFVVLGDLNADSVDGDGMKSAIQGLIYHNRINRSISGGILTPKSLGGRFHRPWQPRSGRSNEWTHLSGLRLDYILPSVDLSVKQTGVFWPDKKDPLRHLITNEKGKERAQEGSDHRLVWADLQLCSQ